MDHAQVAPCGFPVCIYMCVNDSSSVRGWSLHRADSGHGQTEGETDRQKERKSEEGKKKSEQEVLL